MSKTPPLSSLEASLATFQTGSAPLYYHEVRIKNISYGGTGISERRRTPVSASYIEEKAVLQRFEESFVSVRAKLLFFYMRRISSRFIVAALVFHNESIL
jgi:hypothetical protein